MYNLYTIFIHEKFSNYINIYLEYLSVKFSFIVCIDNTIYINVDSRLLFEILTIFPLSTFYHR